MTIDKRKERFDAVDQSRKKGRKKFQQKKKLMKNPDKRREETGDRQSVRHLRDRLRRVE